MFLKSFLLINGMNIPSHENDYNRLKRCFLFLTKTVKTIKTTLCKFISYLHVYLSQLLLISERRFIYKWSCTGSPIQAREREGEMGEKQRNERNRTPYYTLIIIVFHKSTKPMPPKMDCWVHR